MYRFFRYLLFLLPPETAHYFSLRLLKWTMCSWRINKIRCEIAQHPTNFCGLTLPNPVGLAAGLDKNGDYIDALFGLGFGFIEVGAVTPVAQPGNPRPRLFRLPKSSAIINRMGFNNKGVDYLVERLKKRKVSGIVGVNLGKNKETLLENALEDYLICLRKVYPYADFVTVNISSPNTAGLRKLQSREYLHRLLTGLKAEQAALYQTNQRKVPLLIKISPDMSRDELSDFAELLLEFSVDGVIVTNTTQSRDGLEGQTFSDEAGGLSGDPLYSLSQSTLAQLHSLTQGKIPVIAVGGLSNGGVVKAALTSGASLVQIYTALIYQGPGIVKKIINCL